MDKVILFRKYREVEEEYNMAQKYLPCYESRMDIKSGDLVIGRYSVLPYYKDLERDIKKIGAELINSYKQHRYVADISNWYEGLKLYTPKTWFRPEDVLSNETGSFVLKGETNSKKFLWNTHMFAKDRDNLMRIYCNLQDDSLISHQNVCIRQYVPLNTYFVGINGLPVAEEYRFFVCYGKVVSGGFYWSNAIEDVEEMGYKPDVNNVPKDFIDRLIKIISPNINFFVMDIAKTKEGEWILIELNDGQMSGLSENDPNVLYGALSNIVKKDKLNERTP